VREARIGDRYVIASDGLTDYVAGDTIAEIVTAGDPPGPTADRLVELALKAGAPDNVTIVIGDVVDITKVRAPATQPQVVGAAAARSTGTRPIPTTPAAKAAALSREAAGDADDDVTLADEGPTSRRGRWLRGGALLAVLLIVLGGAAYAGYDWSQRQWFVGEADGNVAVYQGVSQDLGPLRLSHVDTTSDVAVTDLPDFYRAKVEDTVSADTREDAEALVEDLRTQADRCRVNRESGDPCATDEATPTPSTTTTSTTPTTTTAPGGTTTTAPSASTTTR
jgi:hypothetical protein